MPALLIALKGSASQRVVVHFTGRLASRVCSRVCSAERPYAREATATWRRWPAEAKALCRDRPLPTAHCAIKCRGGANVSAGVGGAEDE